MTPDELPQPWLVLESRITPELVEGVLRGKSHIGLTCVAGKV
jgi:hypothetical protein